MIWTPIKKLTMLIFVFVSILFVFYLLVLYGVINISAQYLSIIALIEIVIWLGMFMIMMRLMIYENLKDQYDTISQNTIIFGTAGIAQKVILRDKMEQFEKKFPLTVSLYNFLS